MLNAAALALFVLMSEEQKEPTPAALRIVELLQYTDCCLNASGRCNAHNADPPPGKQAGEVQTLFFGDGVLNEERERCVRPVM